MLSLVYIYIFIRFNDYVLLVSVRKGMLLVKLSYGELNVEWYRIVVRCWSCGVRCEASTAPLWARRRLRGALLKHLPAPPPASCSPPGSRPALAPAPVRSFFPNLTVPDVPSLAPALSLLPARLCSVTVSVLYSYS